MSSCCWQPSCYSNICIYLLKLDYGGGQLKQTGQRVEKHQSHTGGSKWKKNPSIDSGKEESQTAWQHNET